MLQVTSGPGSSGPKSTQMYSLNFYIWQELIWLATVARTGGVYGTHTTGPITVPSLYLESQIISEPAGCQDMPGHCLQVYMFLQNSM